MDQLEMLHEKLDSLREEQRKLSTGLEVHIATENASWDAINKKLDDHIQDHKDATTVWRKGAVGMIFMLVGTAVAWVISVIWSLKR